MCRRDRFTGNTLGGSFGFQAGVQSTDVVLIFSTQRGVDSIVHGKFTLGADASVAAGPVGRAAEASIDEKLKAEIADMEEEIKAKRRQLVKFEEAKKLFEGM